MSPWLWFISNTSVVDWIQDSIIERNRRIRKAKQLYTTHRGPRGELSIWWLWSRLRKVLDAGQSWFVVTLVGRCSKFARIVRRLVSPCVLEGACIGVNAALISIVTEWLSDLKTGYCYDGWWLNQQFCCWEIEFDDENGCDSWHPWSLVWPGQYTVYIIFAVSITGRRLFTLVLTIRRLLSRS